MSKEMEMCVPAMGPEGLHGNSSRVDHMVKKIYTVPTDIQ